MFHHGFHHGFCLLDAIKLFFEGNKMFHRDLHLPEVERCILNATLAFVTFRRHVGKTIKGMVSRPGGIGFRYKSELACDCKLQVCSPGKFVPVCMCWHIYNIYIFRGALSLSHQVLVRELNRRGEILNT